MALTTRTVKATFTRPSGSAAAGTVQFRPSVVLQNGGTGVITPTTGLTATLSGGGAISILLPTTTQATTPATFFYYVTERIDDQERSYQILLPTGVGDAQLAALAPPGPATQPSLYTLQSTTAALAQRVTNLENGTPDPPIASDIGVDPDDTPGVSPPPNNQRDVNTAEDTRITDAETAIASAEGTIADLTTGTTGADNLTVDPADTPNLDPAPANQRDVNEGFDTGLSDLGGAVGTIFGALGAQSATNDDFDDSITACQQVTTPLNTATLAGTIGVFDGTDWQILTPGADGDVLTYTTADGVHWAAP